MKELSNIKKDFEELKKQFDIMDKQNNEKNNQIELLKKENQNQKQNLESKYSDIEKKYKNIEKELNSQIKINKEKDEKIKILENKIKNQKKEYELNLNHKLKQMENEFINKIKECEIKIDNNKEDLIKKYNEISEKEKCIENKIFDFENTNNFLKIDKCQMYKLIYQNEILIDSNIKNPIYNIYTKDNNILNCLDIIKKEENKINEKDLFFLTDKKPTLIGLDEIENGSFMNAALQCLSQTIDLTKYFLNNQDTIKSNNIGMGLSNAYLEIIKKLWEINGPKSFSPINFKNALDKIKPIFKENEPQYYSNYLFTIIEQLDKEQRKILNCKFKCDNDQPNQYNKKDSIQHFFRKFQDECSIISDIFIGILEINKVCHFCKNIYKRDYQICYHYEKFNYLLFPLEEIRYQIIENPYFDNKQIMENSKISLYECFKYYQKINILGSNKICNKCKKSDIEITNKLYSCSNYLIIVLSRKKNNDIKLIIEEYLDVTEFIIEKDLPKITYSLYGIISRLDENNSNPHYIASCKSEIDLKWYRYNNDKVTKISIQEEVLSFGQPCILLTIDWLLPVHLIAEDILS